jgi:hypothetical protein
MPRPSEADSGSRRVAPTTEEEVLLDGFLDLGHAPLIFTIGGRRSKVHGPWTPGRDVPDENGTSWVIVQDDGREYTEPATYDARAEASNSKATSDIRFCDICPHCLNGDEQYKDHMQLHQEAKNRLLLDFNRGVALGPEADEVTSGRDVADENETVEDTEISWCMFHAMVTLARDPRSSKILTVLAGLLHKERTDNLRIQKGSSS